MSTIYVFVWLFTMSFGTPAFGPGAAPAPATVEVVQARSGNDSSSRTVVPQAPSKRDLVGEKFFRRY